MKIFIIGHSKINVDEIGIKLQQKNDNLTLSRKFTTIKDYEDAPANSLYYFLDKTAVNISYKNNSVIYVDTIDNDSIGITYDDYYNSDIFCMNLRQFNMLSQSFINNVDDMLVVWVDSKNEKHYQEDIYEAGYVEERIYDLNYMYFLDENIDTITDIINEYIIGNENTRSSLLKTYE